ncbi:unnamed protein product [Ilex paraguariensis]|uniref:Uncharacterized protein n=1 Tax=Ilex paraguariensis TaxID=185542 RepID=A0ABC8S1F7_9AQUA
MAGYEEKYWLPTHVLDEACDASKELIITHYQQHRHGLKSPAPAAETLPLHSKCRLKPHQRPRTPTGWAAGGPGMQAIFLDSGQRSCGTGVFLPRMAGTQFQLPTKPACSPVLLPSRVVQALNLNVHELGLQIKPRDLSNNSKSADHKSHNNKKGNDVSGQCCVLSQNRSSSSEIFLPKDWTY